MSVNIVDVGVSTILGARQDQEDRYITLPPGSLKSRKEIAIYAVYDGHGGTEVVNYVSQHLHEHLEQHLTNPTKATSPVEYKIAIQSALRSIDKDLDRDNLDGGSTVTLALIDTKQNLLVHANLGDSHAFFADHEPASPQSLSPSSPTHGGGDTNSCSGLNWHVDCLSVEHAPDSPLEKQRIEKAGGEINYRSGIARIGGVSMSRALGDLDYKKPRVNRLAGHDLSDLIGVETGLAPGKKATHDLVSNKADFAVRMLHGQSLLLLASDGVGDASQAEEVTRLAVDRWEQGKDAKEIAEELTSREGKMKGADNCTVVVVVLDTESKRRRSVDSGRRSFDVSGLDGSRRRRRSSITSLKEWIMDR
ncbi:PTC1, serine threonine protein phosphatase [Pyrenophora tritici-repentis]|uniref:Protein phosphatase 2C family protein n=1 Tax=Pyrenophora tritici-repentis (strain Pt-1C-BFP) TaxID=426418 RepID=B2WM52_PYRTR|nr:protein phosphatase 2C family protein [Pyrenophora tritici-repentis Pt-1C-BFP]EDU44112.1 protein phosphatase 2C family protein [Pyrenophora tritici-repentis Pt-1C-BFP]KAF7442790.1 Protein phosphatase 2C family protein [Pyrenophora tritici-repentis]KAI1582619.1 PTC1 Serine threonine protein phosphatase [Pyrenophora tritici-repentis]PZD33120.1 PTC1, serine threonine protein phosphatase [Pyrenophora tritici-repentis]